MFYEIFEMFMSMLVIFYIISGLFISTAMLLSPRSDELKGIKFKLFFFLLLFWPLHVKDINEFLEK